MISYAKIYRFLQSKVGSFGCVDSRIVLTCDMIISIVASLCVALIVKPMSGDENFYFIKVLISSFLASIVAFALFHTYRIIVRHTRVLDMKRIACAVLTKVVIIVTLWLFIIGEVDMFNHDFLYLLLVVCVLEYFITFSLLVLARVLLIDMYEKMATPVTRSRSKLMVYGTTRSSISLLSLLTQSKKYEICGILNFDSKNFSQKVFNYKVFPFNTVDDLESIFKKQNFSFLIFPTLRDLHQEEERVVKFCHDCGVKMLISPNIDNALSNDNEFKLGIREIKIEDLLGRDEIQINMKEVRRKFLGKIVMVTGAAGSIGSELCRQMATLGASTIVLFDNAETPLHDIRIELDEKWGKNAPDGERVKIVPIIGNVCERDRLEYVFERYQPQIVFHAAAYKHVPLMEENPCEAIKTNVTGTRNVADCCIKYGVSNMIMISTDKAVNPTNVMGATKRAAEMYVQGLSQNIASGGIKCETKFTTTRFGNVLGSNGSVVPLFQKQLENGGPLTVTSPEICRFFMSIPEACRLVSEATSLGMGGDIFVFDMGEPVKIIDLAKNMIKLAGYVPEKDIKIEITGLRPGEKLYEEVLATEENSTMTEHPKIRKAKIRSVNFDEVQRLCNELDVRATVLKGNCNCQMEVVSLLKQLVPEFKSQNSIFEKLDN